MAFADWNVGADSPGILHLYGSAAASLLVLIPDLAALRLCGFALNPDG
jgi:hypothetical protein